MKDLISLFVYRKDLNAMEPKLHKALQQLDVLRTRVDKLTVELAVANELIDSLCVADTAGLDKIGEERRLAAFKLSTASGMRGARLVERQVAIDRVAALNRDIEFAEARKKELAEDWGVK